MVQLYDRRSKGFMKIDARRYLDCLLSYSRRMRAMKGLVSALRLHTAGRCDDEDEGERERGMEQDKATVLPKKASPR